MYIFLRRELLQDAEVRHTNDATAMTLTLTPPFPIPIPIPNTTTTVAQP
jgi:hypothetical protein